MRLHSYDYSGASRLLFVRMLSPLHEVFLRALESRINRWLEEIRCGSDRAAFFAQKILPSGSAAVQFAEGDSLSRQSHHDPDSSFCHMDAHYPGIVIEISYSHKRKRLSRLAEDYLLGTDGGVRLVVALDIEYGAKRSRKATMSVWRSQVITTADGDKRRVLHEVLNDVSLLLRYYSVITPCWCPPRRDETNHGFNILYRPSATSSEILPNMKVCGFD